MNSPRALSCWVQPGKVESVGVHELVLEGESRSSWQIFLEERGSQVGVQQVQAGQRGQRSHSLRSWSAW